MKGFAEKRYIQQILLFSLWSMEWASCVADSDRNINTDIPFPSNIILKDYNRGLRNGDFEELNALLQGTTINLDPQVLENRVGDIFLDEIQCFNLRIDNILFQNRDDFFSNKIINRIEIQGLSLDCTFDWKIGDRGWLGSGDGLINSSGNNIQTEKSIRVDDSNDGVALLTLESCAAEVEIRDIELSGGVLGFLANFFASTFETLVKDRIETVLEEIACNEFLEFVSGDLTEQFENIHSNLETILQVTPSVTYDPFAIQNEFTLNNNNSEYINFMSNETMIESFAMKLIYWLGDFLAYPIKEGNSTSASETLRINSLISENLLDSNGTFLIPLEQLNRTETIYDNQNLFAKTIMNVTAISVLGMDSISLLEPFRAIASQTLETNITWKSLEFIFNVTIDISPSSSSDVVTIDPSVPDLMEYGQISVAIEELNITTAVLMGFDLQNISNVEIGALIDISHLFQCIGSASAALNVSGLQVSIGDIKHPEISGFISPGIDRIAKAISEIFAFVFESKVLTIIPKLIMSQGVNQINDVIFNRLNKEDTKKACLIHRNQTYSEFINLTQLFSQHSTPNTLQNETDYYGDLPTIFQNTIQDLIVAEGSDGLPLINENFIRPRTLKQSNETGVLNFTTVYKLPTPCLLGFLGFKNVTLDLREIRLENIDSIGYPFNILESSGSYELSNYASIGANNKPVTTNAKILLTYERMNAINSKEFEVSFRTLEEINLLNTFHVQIDSEALFMLTAQQLLDPSYWLSTHVERDEGNFRRGLTNSIFTKFELLNLDLLPIQNIGFDAACTSCSATISNQLDLILEGLKVTGILNELIKRSLSVFVDSLKSIRIENFVGLILCRQLPQAPFDPFERCEEVKPIFDRLNFSRESVEFLLSALTLFLQVSAAMISVFISNMNIPESNPLWGEMFLSRVNNFTNFLENSPEENGTVIPKGRSSVDKVGINSIIEYTIAKQESFTFAPSSYNVSVAGIQFILDSINIRGLESLFYVDIFNAIAPHTARSQFELGNLGIDLNLTISQQTIRPLDNKRIPWEEYLNVSLDFQDVDVDVTTLVAIDNDKLDDLRLGTFLNNAGFFSCIQSFMDSMFITGLHLNVGSMSDIKTEGFFSENAKNILISSYSTIFDYNVTTNFSSSLEFFLREGANDFIQNHIFSKPATSCHEIDSYGDMEFIDFRELFFNNEKAKQFGASGEIPYGESVSKLRNFILSQIENGSLRINEDIIVPFTERIFGLPGTIFFDQPFDMSNVKIPILDKEFDLIVKNVMLDNVDSFGDPLSVLIPRVGSGNILDSSLIIGSKEKPLKISGIVLLTSLEGDGKIVENELDFVLKMSDVQVSTSVLINASINALMNLQIQEMKYPSCWLATIPSSEEISNLEIVDIGISFETFNFDVKCLNCESPEVEKLSTLSTMFLKKKMISSVIDTVLESTLLQTGLDRILIDSHKKCLVSKGLLNETLTFNRLGTNSQDQMEHFVGTSFEIVISLSVILGSIVIAACSSIYVIERTSRRKRCNLINSLSEQEMNTRLDHQEAIIATLKEKTKYSMFSNVEIPSKARIAIPAGIIINIALFLSCHLQTFAAISFDLETQILNTSADRILEFSIAKMTFGVWSSGSEFLAFCIFFLSIVWPYIRLISMFWLFFSQRLDISRRGVLLRWIDTIGKWSLLDIFVMIIALVSLRTSISNSQDENNPREIFYNIDLMLIPVYGVYSNLAAQTCSQIISHLLMFYHRKTLRSISNQTYQKQSPSHECSYNYTKESSRGNSSTEIEEESIERQPLFVTCNIRKALCSQSFTLLWQNKEDSLQMRNSTNTLVRLICLSSIVCIFLGSYFASFKIGLLGVLGIILENNQHLSNGVPSYSLFSVSWLMVSESTYLESLSTTLGLLLLASFFIVTTVIGPCLLAVSLYFLWFVPMSYISRTRLIETIHIFRNWQFLDVYLVSIILSTWQIGGVLEYMLSPYCQAIGAMLGIKEERAHLGGSHQCFSGEAQLRPAIFFLLFASIMLRWLTHFSMMATAQQSMEYAIIETHSIFDVSCACNKVSLKDKETDDKRSGEVRTPIYFSDYYSFFLEKSKN